MFDGGGGVDSLVEGGDSGILLKRGLVVAQELLERHF